MNNIKVAQIITVSSSLKGLMLNQMRSLQGAGYAVVGISSPGPEVPLVEAAGIHHIAVPMEREIVPPADLKTLWRLYRIMRREQFTIVHTHLAKASLLGQVAARMANVPIVLNTVHGYHFHEHMPARKRQFYIALERFSARYCDMILSQNQEDIQTALTEKISPPEKLRHIGNGIDLTMFTPAKVSHKATQAKRAELGIPPATPVVGFVGRLAAKRKGFLDFLRAGQCLTAKAPDVQFLIAGEVDHGKSDAVEAEAAKDYGIYERCHFIGFRPNEEMPLWYRIMDVLVLPSPFEGIPRAIMEASAMGVPVVATNARGNREAVQDGRNGRLVPFGDVPALVQAIAAILANRAEAARMGQVGVSLAQSYFDERQVFERVKHIYAELLQQKTIYRKQAAIEIS